MSTISDIVESNLKLKSHDWSDREVRAIPTPDLARHAYRASESLRTKYPSEESFVAHWAGQRRQNRLSVPASSATEDSEREARIQREWDGSASLREEFNDNVGAYKAFLKAESQGLIRIATRRGSAE